MSGPTKDLFSEPNDTACRECHTIFKGRLAEKYALECARSHELERRREKARAFARTGVSQYPKSETRS